MSENVHICDTNQRSLGPIKLDPLSSDKSQPVFFFANHDSLETERFEFYKNKQSQVGNTSYIYMIYEQENVDVDTLSNYLETNTDDTS